MVQTWGKRGPSFCNEGIHHTTETSVLSHSSLNWSIDLSSNIDTGEAGLDCSDTVVLSVNLLRLFLDIGNLGMVLPPLVLHHGSRIECRELSCGDARFEHVVELLKAST